MGIIIGGLGFIQIRLGNHIIGIVILDQRSVLPILLIVQCHLRIGTIGLRRGDRQFGIRDRCRGRQLTQSQVGLVQLDLLGSIVQMDQYLTCLDLVTKYNINKRDISSQTKSHMGLLVGNNDPGSSHA